MTNSSRREALTMGLVVSGLAGIVGRAFGQQPREVSKDREGPVRAPGQNVPKIGTVRLATIFKGYRKAALWAEQVKTDREAKNKELQKLLAQLDSENERFRVLRVQPNNGTSSAKSLVQIRQLERAYETARSQGAAELSRRQVEGYAQLYKDVQRVVAAIARERGLTAVLDVKDEPLLNDDGSGFPAHAVIYADPATDITGEVITELNRPG